MIQVWRLIQTLAWFQLNESKYFPSSSKPAFQREGKGEAWKWRFILMQTHYHHKKG